TATVSAPIVINVIEKANEAPKVTITAPSTNSQFIQGDNISITSVATDTDGTISKVEFYNGTTLLGTDTSAPYSFDWTNLPIGNFSITAKATDNKGAATVSAPIVIYVIEKANEAPKVTITAPGTSSQFIQGDNISITSVATDTDGTIAKVDFYNETSLLGTDTSAPYSFDWTNLPIGNFSITAKATDNKGAATVSAPVVINVIEKANDAPKVAITAPSTNSQFIQGDQLSITANATDSDGTIVKVDFYNGTSLLGTDTSAPYSFDWINLPIGNFSITAKATDNKGTAAVSSPVVINVTEKANEAPKVTITAPSTNSQFTQGDNISITSVATDTDGTIAKVDFYNGTSLLGTDTTAPYSFDWT
ncbi:Ig-like domain-containing protein, partial [Algoriphagus ratkowskyi]